VSNRPGGRTSEHKSDWDQRLSLRLRQRLEGMRQFELVLR